MPTGGRTGSPRVVPVRSLNVESVRRDFPILSETIRHKPLVYLDNAATSQKPLQVIDAISRVYRSQNANIHRGVHFLSELATAEYEQARERIRYFVNASDNREIVFVRGATEAINLVAYSWGRMNLEEGDEILVTHLEHHANIVPWQMICQQTGAVLRVAPIDDHGSLILPEFEALLGPRTKLAAFTHVSNALGTVNPVAQMTAMARERGIVTLVDAAQSVPHIGVDFEEIGCDFMVFSGHKMCGPTGIGVLVAKLNHLEQMPPWQGGGDMIKSVSFEKTIYNDPPGKFEAGTPDIAGAIGLGAAVDYLLGIGMDLIAGHESSLVLHATEELSAIPGVRIIGNSPAKAAVVSFVIDGVHPHDIGTILDQEGIAIRAGHHCAQPAIERMGLDATARASFAFYNTHAEVEALARGLRRVTEVFA